MKATLVNRKDISGMFSKTGKETYEMYRSIQTKDDVLFPHLRKKKAVKLLDELEILVEGFLEGNQVCKEDRGTSRQGQRCRRDQDLDRGTRRSHS